MKKIKEGQIELEIEEGRPWDKDVFYNPKMVYDRNLSVAVASYVKPKTICDPLSASGVRGIRYRIESDVEDVHINDADQAAYNSMLNNCQINDVDCTLSNEDAGIVLRRNKFDYIDLDPFGSPTEFFDSTGHSIRDGGFICATVTDTAAVFGTYPRVSRRRYGRKSFRSDFNKELGLRIIVSSIIDSLGRYKKTFYPKLCYFREHYARVFGEVVEGATPVQDNFRDFGFISFCSSCGWRASELSKKCKHCGERTEYSEVYLGELNNTKFCSDVAEECKNRGFNDVGDMVEDLSQDIDIPFHYDLHYLAKKIGTTVPSKSKFIEKLNDFEVKESVYSPTAVKTNAPYSKLIEVIEDLTT